MLSKSISTSKKFSATGKTPISIEARASEFPQLLYCLLMPHCDDFGRQPGDAFTVKHEVFPTSDRPESDFELALQSLERTAMIHRYSDGVGGIVLQIVLFDKHQQGLHKRTKSQFPEPPGNSGNAPEVPGNSGGDESGLNFDLPGDSGNPPEIPGELNRTELNRTESIYGGAAAPRFPRAVEGNKKQTSTWCRALGIAHRVITDFPDNPENWTYATKERLETQHMDPRQRSPRGGQLFHDAVDYAIQQRRETGEPNCGRPKPKTRRA